MDYKPLIDRERGYMETGTSMEQDSEETEEPGLRMVLVGRTGSGKSATGNTILGKTVFKSEFSPAAVTPECQKELGEFRGQILSVVDTPGLCDNSKDDEDVKMEIFRCMSFIAPGPHVFLVVIGPGRFTREEEATVQLIKDIFGENASSYTMALFTHGDVLETKKVSMEPFIYKNPSLRNFIQQCDGRYHVFNNNTEDSAQVRELLQKINKMVDQNGGSFYTSHMLGEAEKAIREKMTKLLRKYPQMKAAEARRRAERNNKFLKACVAASGLAASVVGAGAGVGVEVLIGAGVGAVGGPVGAAVGAALGLAVAGAAVAVKRKACVIQ